MKAVVIDIHWYFTTRYIYYNDSNGNVVRYVEGLESYLLRFVLEHMNMTFDHVPTPEYLFGAMFSKEAYIALGNKRARYLLISFLDSTNSHYMMSVHWYVPCSVISKMEQHLSNTVCGIVVSSDHLDCDCGHFDYTFWAIKLHI
jgi:hypothetical protein